MTKTISLIIPTYNERDNIAPLLKRLENVLANYSYETIFVDDNSADGTAEVAASLADKYPVRIIVRKDKRGLASAIVDGLSHVSGEIIAVMDADLQHPPEVLLDLVKGMDKGADMVIASRYVDGGSCPGWSLSRRLVSRGAIFLAHLLLPATRQVNDPVSGFFIFNKEVVAGAELKPLGYKILLEILTEGHFKRIAEVPYIFGTRNRGKSKLSASQQVAYLRHILSLMKRSGELLRFLKFCLVGISGVVVNMGLLWLLTERAGLFYLVSATIGIETSITSNFILNNYFTFASRRHPGVKSFLNQLLKFNVVSIVGIAINLAILWVLTEVPGVFYLISNLFGIAAATLWNFLVNNWWTWKV